MKAIMISIKPKWCAKIMNSEKTIEIRKNKALANAIQKLINENGYADIYVYCSKNKNIKLVHSIGYYYVDIRKVGKLAENNLNGKVIFKFRCYKMEEIAYQRVFERNPFHFLEEESGYGTKTINAALFKKATCLTDKELEQYLNTDKPNKHAYAIHINNLEIFDKPRELSEFRHYKRVICYNADFDYTTIEYRKICLTKAPQNFCYVEVEQK